MITVYFNNILKILKLIYPQLLKMSDMNEENLEEGKEFKNPFETEAEAA